MTIKNHVGTNLPFSILFSSLLFLVFIQLTSCEKNTSDSSDLVGNWKRRSEFEGVGRTEAVSFTIGTKVFVGGGYDGSDRLNDFWSFDQNTGTWLRIADFPGNSRNSAVAFAINGKGYVGTGYDDNDTKLKDFWEYDPGTNIWTRKADFGGTGRYNAIGFSIGDKGYVGTGYDGNYLKDMWQYDPSANTWTQVASLTGSKRSEASVFVYNSLAYVVTGLNNGSYLADMWMYNPATNTWTEKRKINDATDEDYDDDYDSNIQRANGTIFIIADKAYLTCGTNGSTTAGTWEYDIVNDQWYQKTSFEGSAREGAIGFTITNRGYIVTGSNSSYRFDDLWEFLPNEEQSDSDN
ncbi:MAG: galactose oxidase [Bacteroidetes bacterium]|nr:galactose oxidase [Bacteroidota bacterium]